jgi:CheY-like chemotaxis protein
MATPRILVVEDEEPLARILSFTFENEGYVVARAEDGVDCMNKAVTFDPDMVIMDLMMPKMGGLEAIKLLRHRQTSRELYIIALTARSRAVDREEALAAGADLFVHKPFQIPRLLEQIDRLLASRRVR